MPTSSAGFNTARARAAIATGAATRAVAAARTGASAATEAAPVGAAPRAASAERTRSRCCSEGENTWRASRRLRSASRASAMFHLVLPERALERCAQQAHARVDGVGGHVEGPRDLDRRHLLEQGE